MRISGKTFFASICLVKTIVFRINQQVIFVYTSFFLEKCCLLSNSNRRTWNTRKHDGISYWYNSKYFSVHIPRTTNNYYTLDSHIHKVLSSFPMFCSLQIFMTQCMRRIFAYLLVFFTARWEFVRGSSSMGMGLGHDSCTEFSPCIEGVRRQGSHFLSETFRSDGGPQPRYPSTQHQPLYRLVLQYISLPGTIVGYGLVRPIVLSFRLETYMLGDVWGPLSDDSAS